MDISQRRHEGDAAEHAFAIGLDVGSTTSKAVVVEVGTKRIVWSRYQRHDSLLAESVIAMLREIEESFHGTPPLRLFATGSGVAAFVPLLGARFVHEINAVTLAVELLHPDVQTVIELGGQDAKMIHFQTDPGSGVRHATHTMNDRCASGTGATIDRCIRKLSLTHQEVAEMHFSERTLHHVAAKCGVFAATDIVNLLKRGIPIAEIICSLGDAIVLQNLSVLARGNSLHPKVLLLGGPHAYFPWLRECWRTRIPRTWDERGISYPSNVPIESLIFAPSNALLYGAYGSVLFGLQEPEGTGTYLGRERLRQFIERDREAHLRQRSGPPLVRDVQELQAFRAEFAIPKFEPARFASGTPIRGVIGLDGGSTSSKAVLVDLDGNILTKVYELSQGNPLDDTKRILRQLASYAHDQGCSLEIRGLGVTGYAADMLEHTIQADLNIVETVAHAVSALHYFPDADVVCDIGGQDIKVLFLQQGKIKNFRLSNQCSAGNGMLLQAMADQFGIRLEDYADVAFQANLAPRFHYGCAVFLDADRVNFQKEGFSPPQLLAGLAQVLPQNIWQYVVQVPRLAELGRSFILQGGTQYNLAALKAQVDYLRARVPGGQIHLHPHPGEAGAIGAAFETLRIIRERDHSRFIGIDAVLQLDVTVRNDEQTRCVFCPNHCARTFVEAHLPDGSIGRFISGFACEKGSAASKQELREVLERRKDLNDHYPNLVELEANLMFEGGFEPDPLPDAGTPVADVEVRRSLFARDGFRRRPITRGFQRSATGDREHRRGVRIGMPRVLDLYALAPWFLTYFRTLGLTRQQIVFSDFTSEELWLEGGKYGSIDPCFPAKVAQAHIHDLLYHKHSRTPFEYLFFPCITHLPTWVTPVVDAACCPVAAGTPKVLRAAFTKEKDLFAERGIEYLDAVLQFQERHYLRKEMFEVWGSRLRITHDESDFACDQGWRALDDVDRELQRRGRDILEDVTRRRSLAILLLARPYHDDPGLNHGILKDLQALGFPILTVTSLPRDAESCAHLFKDDLKKGTIESPFDIRDVWPENFSAHSSQKVWAAKVAARCRHIMVLDFSSFKCGPDAPIYNLVDNIVRAGRNLIATLHDLDATKPTGTFQIRLRTIAHALRQQEQFLRQLPSEQEGSADFDANASRAVSSFTEPPPEVELGTDRLRPMKPA